MQAAFSAEVLELGENSRIVEILDDHVAVLRVGAHHPPREQPLEAVRAEIEAELARAAAEALADAAAAAFLARAVAPAPLEAGAGDESGAVDGTGEVDSSGAADPLDPESAAASSDAVASEQEPAEELESDPEAAPEPPGASAALAEELGGVWTGSAWIRRTDTAVPPGILASVFGSRPGDGAAAVRERVALAGGDEAVVLVTGIRPGNADRLTREELQARLTQMAQATAQFELSGYAQHVREQASVRIPDEVLDPPLF